MGGLGRHDDERFSFRRARQYATSGSKPARTAISAVAALDVVATSRRRRSDGDANFDAHRLAACGEVTWKRKRAPSTTPAATRREPDDGTTIRRCPQQRSHALAPRPAAAAAARAGAAHRHLQRHGEAVARGERRDAQLRGQHVGRRRLAEKRAAHPLHDVADRGKVDRDLVRKAVPRRRLPGGRRARRRAAVEDDTVRGCMMNPLTIGAGPALVKAATRMLVSHESCPR